MIKSVDELVDIVGGNVALADMLGVGSSAISNYKADGAFPAGAGPIIGEICAGLGRRFSPKIVKPLQRPTGAKKRTAT